MLRRPVFRTDAGPYWLGEKIVSLFSIANESYGAIVAALGRGDIEAAIQVIWATIQLVWTKGTATLAQAWDWLTETLQTTWATCVYKISELLTTAWYGVQNYWTETVYTMSTIWTEFSSGVVSAWKTAEKVVAKGIGYLMAKMKGLDPNEMSRTLDEDYRQQSLERETEKKNKLSEIQDKRDEKIASLETDKKGTLDSLKGEFEASGKIRDAFYDDKLSKYEADYAAARAAYNKAIEAARVGEGSETFADKLKKMAEKVMGNFSAMNLGDKMSGISSKGTFSAFAVNTVSESNYAQITANAALETNRRLAAIERKLDDDDMI